MKASATLYWKLNIALSAVAILSCLYLLMLYVRVHQWWFVVLWAAFAVNGARHLGREVAELRFAQREARLREEKRREWEAVRARGRAKALEMINGEPIRRVGYADGPLVGHSGTLIVDDPYDAQQVETEEDKKRIAEIWFKHPICEKEGDR